MWTPEFYGELSSSGIFHLNFESGFLTELGADQFSLCLEKHTSMASVYIHNRDQNSCPYVWATSSFPTELSPQP